MTRWVKDGTPPPAAPPIEIVTENGKPAIDRDSFGNALGGIRLAEHAVAAAVNSGENTGTGFCFYRLARRLRQAAALDAVTRRTSRTYRM